LKINKAAGNMKKKILVTGGLGYIGSHTVVELLQHGYDVVIADNLSNAQMTVLDSIEIITGLRPIFYYINVCDKEAVNRLFQKETPIDAVIHFAAYKAVNESVKRPLKYFHNNLLSLITVLGCMEAMDVNGFVFSSSATVYGNPETLPVTETSPVQKALSAYGSTKQMGEEICERVAAVSNINAIALRYFNPVGAHDSGLIGESPSGTPNNLMPYITQVVKGKQQSLTVYGSDYPTADGTCIRDYIHVVDLAKAHVAAFKRLLQNKQQSVFEIFNLGTGKGTSVFELIGAFEKQNGVEIPFVVGERRAGDTPVLYAEVKKAYEQLGWKATLTIKDIVKSAWKFEKTLKS
jgi:UDP-glucose 4-epimerase